MFSLKFFSFTSGDFALIASNPYRALKRVVVACSVIDIRQPVYIPGSVPPAALVRIYILQPNACASCGSSVITGPLCPSYEWNLPPKQTATFP